MIASRVPRRPRIVVGRMVESEHAAGAANAHAIRIATGWFGRKARFRIVGILAGHGQVVAGVVMIVAVIIVVVSMGVGPQRAQPLLQFRIARRGAVGINDERFPFVRVLQSHEFQRTFGVLSDRGRRVAHGL